jgi:hypothetical protein
MRKGKKGKNNPPSGLREGGLINIKELLGTAQAYSLKIHPS